MAFNIVTHVIFCFFLGLGAPNGLQISLYEYGTGETEAVTKRLVANKDMVVFRGQVDYSDDPEAQFVYFQTMKKNDTGYIYQCHIDLKDQCIKTEYFSAECGCTKITDHLVEINVSVRASVSLNGALLRGTVIQSFDNKQFISKEREFPIMYDTQENNTINVIPSIILCVIILALTVLILYPSSWSFRTTIKHLIKKWTMARKEKQDECAYNTQAQNEEILQDSSEEKDIMTDKTLSVDEVADTNDVEEGDKEGTLMTHDTFSENVVANPEKVEEENKEGILMTHDTFSENVVADPEKVEEENKEGILMTHDTFSENVVADPEKVEEGDKEGTLLTHDTFSENVVADPEKIGERDKKGTLPTHDNFSENMVAESEKIEERDKKGTLLTHDNFLENVVAESEKCFKKQRHHIIKRRSKAKDRKISALKTIQRSLHSYNLTNATKCHNSKRQLKTKRFKKKRHQKKKLTSLIKYKVYSGSKEIQEEDNPYDIDIRSTHFLAKIPKTINRDGDSQEDFGTYDSPEVSDKEDSQEEWGTHNSPGVCVEGDIQHDGDTVDCKEVDCTVNSKDNDGKHDSNVLSFNTNVEGIIPEGSHKTEVSGGGGPSLQYHYSVCRKNRSHTKFVSVNDFNINHLPEGHHDNDLVEYIKATADLTVRVLVKMTSIARPEFWRNSKAPYPFYDKKGDNIFRLGTGSVSDVTKWTEEVIKKYNKGTCPCHKCQHSDTPSQMWGEVRMHTATHVVFDELEARNTTCRLFFDGQDSPLVTLDGWALCEASIEEDWCVLKHTTCDVDLLDKLNKMFIHWLDVRAKVHNKYKSSRDKDKLTFIVSHPHGCPKKISVGHWIDRYVLDDDDYNTKYTYTTCTCPGSAGSNVNILGYNDVSPFSFHVHSGVNSKGNNFSGIGREFPLL